MVGGRRPRSRARGPAWTYRLPYVEQHSKGGLAASRAAFENMENYYQNQLASEGSQSQQLQENLAKLQQFIEQKTSEEVSKTTGLLKKLVTAQANMLAAEQRQFDLKHKLALSRSELTASRETSNKLISARDLLNSKVAAMEKETAAARERVKKEIQRLEMKIREQETEVQEKQALPEGLERDMEAEKKRQEESRAALEAANHEADRHKGIAKSLQQRVASLQDKRRELAQVIRDQEVTISRLQDHERELEADAAKQRRIANDRPEPTVAADDRQREALEDQRPAERLQPWQHARHARGARAQQVSPLRPHPRQRVRLPSHRRQRAGSPIALSTESMNSCGPPRSGSTTL